VVKTMLKEFGNGGWIATHCSGDLWTASSFRTLFSDACQFIFCAANYSASAYPGLTDGAARLIENFGSKALYEALCAQDAQGSMAGDYGADRARSREFPFRHHHHGRADRQGYYKIRGQKYSFPPETTMRLRNVVHLMLAKIAGGAPRCQRDFPFRGTEKTVK